MLLVGQYQKCNQNIRWQSDSIDVLEMKYAKMRTVLICSFLNGWKFYVGPNLWTVVVQSHSDSWVTWLTFINIKTFFTTYMSHSHVSTVHFSIQNWVEMGSFHLNFICDVQSSHVCLWV